MAWLVVDERVLASAEVVRGRRDKARGLLGRADHEGALVLTPCRWIHTFGMQFALDVGYLDAEGVVLKTVRMNRNRMGLPILKAQVVIEAEAGAFARWGLHVVELRQ